VSRPLRVAVTVDPYLPVPPVEYGGIERVVAFLVDGLADRGHEVTLIAHPGSATKARLVAYGRPPHVGWVPRAAELVQVGAWLWRHRSALDLVHSFGRLAALAPILPVRSLVKIQSYQRAQVPWNSITRATALAGRSIVFTGCSSSVYRRLDMNGRADDSNGRWRTVFNGVDTARYTPRSSVDPDAPLMFLGRIERIKGTHHAIEIARRAGRRLVIAGIHETSGPHGEYFDREIRPAIDGTRVIYIGPVDDDAKNRWLGQAAALLMPIAWEEPFGIVMAEAFACGTPVVAFRRGSVPEVVIDGVNGFTCRSADDAVQAVASLDRIDRRAVRADCERRFGASVIVDEYEALYYEQLARDRRHAESEGVCAAS